MKIATNANMSIHMHAVSKSFQTQSGSAHVLQDINQTFKQNQTYAIVGSSGSGKSTLLHIIAGLMPASSGAILINQKDRSSFNATERRCFLGQTIGLLFQVPHLIKELTVIENVMLKGLIAGRTFEACEQEAQELLAIMHLIAKSNERPPTLSGGQQQCVALARALFGRPAFLLADEPTGDLDPKTGRIVIDLMLNCQKKWGMGVIVSTHDSQVASAMHEVLTLSEGKLHKKKMHSD